MACSKLFVPAISQPMPLLPCRPSLASSSFSGLPLKESLFLGGVSSLREILLLAANSQCPARGVALLPALQVVNAQKKQLNSDSKGDGSVLQSRKRSWDGANALAVTEGLCIVVAAASYTTSALHNKQTPLVASSSAGESKLLWKVGDLSTWYVPALWVALVINVILRSVQRSSSSKSSQKVWEERSIKDFTLDQRVGQLEEEVQGVSTMAQVLSRHLEKLGVRFRVTRRTLRDPIQETLVLTQKTSEVVKALASREEVLEKELEETQRTLVAMQAQQAKQLELLVSSMSKTFKSQEASERRILKELSQRTGEAKPSSKDAGAGVPTLKEKAGVPPSSSRKQQVMKDIGTLWKGLKRGSPEPSNSSSSPSQIKPSVREGATGETKAERKANGHASLTPETKQRPSSKPTSNPDTEFTKEDFWATATPRDTSSSSAASQTVRNPDADPERDSEKESSSTSSSGRLDSFFSNKKRVHMPDNETLMHERDFSDPGVDEMFSQSIEPSNSSTNGFS